VVSTDIRNLAHDSSENAERIKDMVKAVQDQIGAVRRDLENIATNAAAEVEKTKAITGNLVIMEGDTAEVLKGNTAIAADSARIMSSLVEVKKGVDQIAAAAAEAEQAATQAASAATQQSQGAEELAAAIEEISSLADELQSAQ
jgi:methyl-accepting chemotaxis protein